MDPIQMEGSSFRDPAGTVFSESGQVKRAVTRHGQKDYDQLIRSGLYKDLARRRWLVSHEAEEAAEESLYKILIPEQIPVISYPYEWCFSELKDAALLTLDIQLLAVGYGMSLKDAAPFNVQFAGNSPIFIDTLSFEEFKERPWFAYRQFCEMFLAPLALMARRQADFNKYLRVDLDGMNLPFCSQSLPLGTWFHFGYLAHIHLHALSQSKFDRNTAAPPGQKGFAALKFSKGRMVSLVENLRAFVRGLHLKKQRTAFGNYYGECGHYSKTAEDFKALTVGQWTDSATPGLALDLGGNTGKFSRILTRKGIPCVSADSDAYCVEENYQISKRDGDARMMPLVLDLANPSENLGWAGQERAGFFQRVRPDLVLALALIHHLRVTRNVPLELQARFFSRIAPRLVIEFVPKEDPMTRKLLRNRDDVFHDYREDLFEGCFGRWFEIERKARIPETRRTLYDLKRKHAA